MGGRLPPVYPPYTSSQTPVSGIDQYGSGYERADLAVYQVRAQRTDPMKGLPLLGKRLLDSACATSVDQRKRSHSLRGMSSTDHGSFLGLVCSMVSKVTLLDVKCTRPNLNFGEHCSPLPELDNMGSKASRVAVLELRVRQRRRYMRDWTGWRGVMVEVDQHPHVMI